VDLKEEPERGPVRALMALIDVQSVTRSIEFYGKLGFAVGRTVVHEGETEPSWAWLRSDRAHLMVACGDRPVDPAQQGVLFYLYCDDVAAFREELLRKGLQPGPITTPFYSPRGEFPLSDPDGYRLVIAHT
jgi:hypothetical protein